MESLKVLHLYRPVVIVGQDFTNEKRQTIPNQSLTLKDIIKRFIRKESLPVGREGMYAENMGDLEKIAREDITQRMERAETLRSSLSKVKKHQADMAAAHKSPAAGGSGPPATVEGGEAAASAAPLATT